MQLKPASAAALPEKDPDRFKIGTLTYTKAGLAAVFLWLLWGDICITVHSSAVHGVMNLAFKRHGAPNILIGLLVSTLPALLNFTLNPIISTASDRTRTRWGRRIPYLAWSAPVAGALMIVLGFSEDMGAGLARLAHWRPEVAIVIMLAFSFAIFRITDLFVCTVYYYLFNDVVPRPFLARFMALFGTVGQLSGSLYAWYIYQYSEDHMKEILIGAGVLYMVGYALMCIFVKEGKYPPPPQSMSRRQGVLSLAKVYAKECFFHRFYWLYFLSDASWAAVNCGGFALVFLFRDSLGLTLQQIGQITAASGIAAALLLYPAGVIADRIHPLRFMRFTVVLQTFFALAGLNWLFWNPSPHTALLVYIALTVASLPLSVMHRAAQLPMGMYMLPQDRYGQFCAADAMVGSATLAIGGLVAGAFLDVMRWLFNDVLAGGFLRQVRWCYENNDFAYRFIPVWSFFFMGVSTVALFMLYREWMKLGGREHYRPPNPDEPDSKAPG